MSGLFILRIGVSLLVALAGVAGWRLRGAVDAWRAARLAERAHVGRARELAELRENDLEVLAGLVALANMAAASASAEVDDAE